MTNTRRQLTVFGLLLATYTLLTFLVVVLGLNDESFAGQELPPPLDTMPRWLLGLINAGIVLVLYGLLGLAGFRFARKLDLPDNCSLAIGYGRIRESWTVNLGDNFATAAYLLAEGITQQRAGLLWA